MKYRVTYTFVSFFFFSQAFQPINTKNVPRLYNRPWNGDRLQSAPLPAREKTPIFYPSYS